MKQWLRKKHRKRPLALETDLDDSYFDLLTGNDDPFGNVKSRVEDNPAATQTSAGASSVRPRRGSSARIRDVSPNISGLRASGPRGSSRNSGAAINLRPRKNQKNPTAGSSPHVLDLSS